MPYFRAFLSIQRRNFKKAEFTTPLPEAVQTSQKGAVKKSATKPVDSLDMEAHGL